MMCSSLWLTLVAAVLPHRFSKKCSGIVDRYLCTIPVAQIAILKLFSLNYLCAYALRNNASRYMHRLVLGDSNINITLNLPS